MDRYVREVKLRRDKVESFDVYPFSLPVVRHVLDEPEAALSPSRQLARLLEQE
jgi:predicted ATPase